MLIRELILHHLGNGAVHQRGYTLPPSQTPGLRLHPAEEQVDPEPGDLLLLRAPGDGELSGLIDDDLPEGTTVVLLVPTDPAELPVGRVVNALIGAGLQLVEAVVASGQREPTVAVVARRSAATVLPLPTAARALEPAVVGPDGPEKDVLARLLAESVLENLTSRARERVLLAELGGAEDGRRNAEREQQALEQLRALPDELSTVKAEQAALKVERDALKKRLGQVESSTTYRLASKLAGVSGAVRRLPGRPRR
ncbi:hypothetical protein BJ986_002138 [Phycicoccus badiiscoriae]|uniref:Uncharacterized protein n=1 Tax=Pedococcus badiiscoriae TaxID=642776 RepID=A0A852WJ51_9MICO|nr:hypothetical protein [Pedococcus badiiscoriae]NYG07651.1 hypothetical protein [Pedococcus badiiscoriae]